MVKQPPLSIPPQKDVLTLAEAKQRTSNWRRFIKNVYGQQFGNNIPHAVFIPFTDIHELSKLQHAVKEITIPPSNVVERIYIVGVRSYYSFKAPEIPPFPFGAGKYPIEAVLVPVYQTNYREPHSPNEYDYDPNYPTYDLIVPVPTATNPDGDEDEGYSVYDITRPCPNLCDENSELFK